MSSRLAGVPDGAQLLGCATDAALPIRQNACQGREGSALPEPSSE